MSPDADVSENRRSKIGYWLRWVKAAKKAAKDHWEDAKSAWEEYELAKSDDPDKKKKKRGYPIYWFCCKNLESAYYSKTPKIISKRLHGSDDEMALTMSLIQSKLGQFVVDNGNFNEAMCGTRSDYIHAAKATPQVMYAAEM